MVDLELCYAPATEVARRVAARELSPVELTANALARIDQVNPALRAFCFVWHDEAMAAARAAEAAVVRGDALGPLHGVPVALKDTTPTAGHETTLGSWVFDGWRPDRDAYVAEALARAGAVCVGKTTTPEFAHSLVTDSPRWGVTRNPWDPTRSPGGSSGGSAVAVATGCVPLAEGSDMGGSVRIPAAWSGIVGLKPGLGRIPMDVLPGLFDSISHHGPLTRTVDDARLFLACTQGPDDRDVQSVTTPLDLSGPLRGDVRGLRLGLSVDLGCWAVDPAVEAAVREAAAALADAGAVVDEVDVGFTARTEGIWIELWAVFMAAYYGQHDRSRMDRDVVALIEAGERISAVQLKRLEIERTAEWHKLAAVLADHDALLCPTMAVGPYPASKADPPPRPAYDGRYHSPEMTAVFNLFAPCPALSVPCGLDRDGLPVGLQVVGRRWRDDVVLEIGRAVERALPWAHRRPPG